MGKSGNLESGKQKARAAIGWMGEAPRETTRPAGLLDGRMCFHGPNGHPVLEVGASHEPERRPPDPARFKISVIEPGRETGVPIVRFMGREQVRMEQGAFQEPLEYSTSNIQRAGAVPGAPV
jgi:hypothetical protein